MNLAPGSLEAMVKAHLAQPEVTVTPEEIRDTIKKLRKVFPTSDEDAERLARDIERTHDVTMRLGDELSDTSHKPWLDDARSGIEFFYWKRYREYLAQKDFSKGVLTTLHKETDRTLDYLENPERPGRWDCRGMVMGHVQSGKTSNYIGLICKAADAGYRVIIVIAGIHNNLRMQTQVRVDEGFIGFDSASALGSKSVQQPRIGVGFSDPSRWPNPFTNSKRDFNIETARSVNVHFGNLTGPAVFVIKKNSKILESLLKWLRGQNAVHGRSSIREPLLVIDDEADNASINIKHGSEEVSRINGQLRRLLAMFDRSSYVGYTATPFANIFVDPDTDDAMFRQDLFPRDFIVSLSPATNYFGPQEVFEADSPFVRHIRDNEDLLPLTHEITHTIEGLPPSLRTAVRTFVVACAIRRARGHRTAHNSMLVNASRFVRVQGQLRNEIHDLLGRIRRSVRVNASLPADRAVRDPELHALRGVFRAEYEGRCKESWPQVQQELVESVMPIRVVEVNSESPGALDYADYPAGRHLIAVGGYSLSRGMTLEGLVVSYFLRNSLMYDTLMQMCRWFGYRPDYDDLCRVWMTEQAEGWYAHIKQSIEQLRAELREMAAAGGTPREFGLRVRSHPDTLIVTARNKMGSSRLVKVNVGLGNQFVETAVLRRDESSRHANHRAAIRLAEDLRELGPGPEDGHHVGGGRLVGRVPVRVVQSFLRRFRNHDRSRVTEPESVLRYIAARQGDELSCWDILFPGVGKPPAMALWDESLGFRLAAQRRAPGNASTSTALEVTNKRRVASRGVEKTGVDENAAARAEERYQQKRRKNGQNRGVRVNYPDRIYRTVRKRPLLIVHLLAIGGKEDDFRDAKPHIAWSISFPQTQLEQPVEYVVNTTWFREQFQHEDEEELAGDD